MNQPTAALSLQVFTYAISPFDEWHRQAWAGALILIVLIVASVSAVRLPPVAVCSREHDFMGVGIKVEHLNAWFGKTPGAA